MKTRKPITTAKLKRMKDDREPIAVVTAYDYPSGYLADEAEVDVVLVGDSLGNVVLGYDSTVLVTLEDMIHHSKAVTRAVKSAFVVTDMPFATYHGSLDRTLNAAMRIMQEGMAKAVKLEGGKELAPAVRMLTKAGIPVMGHLGLTPQSIHQIGGYKVQGKTNAQAEQMLEDAKALEEAGAFAIVLELVTEELAAYITEHISIPTIGIGAGPNCDGQVLVMHDLLQYGPESAPKRFVRTYGNIGESMRDGFAAYVRDVKSRAFPTSDHAFQMDRELAGKLYGAE